MPELTLLNLSDIEVSRLTDLSVFLVHSRRSRIFVFVIPSTDKANMSQLLYIMSRAMMYHGQE